MLNKNAAFCWLDSIETLYFRLVVCRNLVLNKTFKMLNKNAAFCWLDSIETLYFRLVVCRNLVLNKTFV